MVARLAGKAMIMVPLEPLARRQYQLVVVAQVSPQVTEQKAAMVGHSLVVLVVGQSVGLVVPLERRVEIMVALVVMELRILEMLNRLWLVLVTLRAMALLVVMVVLRGLVELSGC
jgi:hypothetical protein